MFWASLLKEMKKGVFKMMKAKTMYDVITQDYKKTTADIIKKFILPFSSQR